MDSAQQRGLGSLRIWAGSGLKKFEHRLGVVGGPPQGCVPILIWPIQRRLGGQQCNKPLRRPTKQREVQRAVAIGVERRRIGTGSHEEGDRFRLISERSPVQGRAPAGITCGDVSGTFRKQPLEHGEISQTRRGKDIVAGSVSDELR